MNSFVVLTTSFFLDLYRVCLFECLLYVFVCLCVSNYGFNVKINACRDLADGTSTFNLTCTVCTSIIQNKRAKNPHILHCQTMTDGTCIGLVAIENENTHLHALNLVELAYLNSDMLLSPANASLHEILGQFIDELGSDPVPNELSRLMFYRIQSVKRGISWRQQHIRIQVGQLH